MNSLTNLFNEFNKKMAVAMGIRLDKFNEKTDDYIDYLG